MYDKKPEEMQERKPKREQWNSKIGFILAAAGSAIGLGNIWRFPYIMGENGGAAFIVVFLLCIIIIGLPALIAEILIGRATQLNPVGAFKALRNKPLWRIVGGMGIVTACIILSFYGVVAGWSLGYVVEAVSGKFYEFASPDAAREYFESLTQNVGWITGYFAMFMLLTMTLVYSGVQKGIERGSKIMMPLLFVLLIILMIKGITLEDSKKGLVFLFKPDWSKINHESVLLALGQAFFTMSIGMGAMLTYGSYMSKKDSIPSAAVKIATLDTLISLIAGVAIFTALFSFNQEAGAGPGLIFHILPVVFSKMTGGFIFSIVFFILLSIAALTSTISLLEVMVSYFVDEKQWKRKRAVLFCALLTFIFGIPNALSFNKMSGFTFFGIENTFFDAMEFISSTIMLPAGGFLIAIFVGWFWGLDKALAKLKSGAEELFKKNYWIIKLWKFSLKYLVPVFIFLILLYSLGLIDKIL